MRKDSIIAVAIPPVAVTAGSVRFRNIRTPFTKIAMKKVRITPNPMNPLSRMNSR
jgi:hypothetical protein